jgi:hypothetical protein
MGDFTFDDVAQSLLSLFDILIGDDWQEVLYMSIRSQQYAGIVNVVVAGLIMIIMYCFAHCILFLIFCCQEPVPDNASILVRLDKSRNF